MFQPPLQQLESLLEPEKQTSYLESVSRQGHVVERFKDNMRNAIWCIDVLKAESVVAITPTLPQSLSIRIQNHLSEMINSLASLDYGANYILTFSKASDELTELVMLFFANKDKQSLLQETKAARQELKRELSRLNSLSATVDSAEMRLSDILVDALASKQTMEALLNEVQLLKQTTDALAQQGQQNQQEGLTHLNAIIDLQSQAKSNLSEFQSIVRTTTENGQRVNEFASRLAETETDIQTMRTQMDQEYSDLRSDYRVFRNENSQALTDLMESTEQKAKETKAHYDQLINELIRQSSEQLALAKEALAIGTAAGLSSSFAERARRFSGRDITLWNATFKNLGNYWWLILGLGTLVTVSLFSFHLLSNSLDLTETLLRKALFATPALLFGGYCFVQFNKNQRLKEEYEYKAVVSVAFEAYRSVLTSMAQGNSSKAEQELYLRIVERILESPVERVLGSRRAIGHGDSKIISELLATIQKISDNTNPTR